MKRTTRKLSGAAKDRFLARFFAQEPGLEGDVARRLAARSQATFTSVRIRRLARGLVVVRSMQAAPAAASPPAPAEARPSDAAQASAAAPAPEPHAPELPAAAFDPYVFGLVPVFQREGRDGLLAKLATIARVEDLRLMARTQQIVLPEALRRGEAEPAAIRTAITDAVAKRIADRRAAAG